MHVRTYVATYISYLCMYVGETNEERLKRLKAKVAAQKGKQLIQIL